jgi:hypothetical protein
MFQTRLAAAVASLGLLVLSTPAFAASPAPKATPCHDATTGKFVSCSTMKSTSSVTKDANGKCHDASGKYTTCPTSMKSTKTPSAMKSPAAMATKAPTKM